MAVPRTDWEFFIEEYFVGKKNGTSTASAQADIDRIRDLRHFLTLAQDAVSHDRPTIISAINTPVIFSRMMEVNSHTNAAGGKTTNEGEIMYKIYNFHDAARPNSISLKLVVAKQRQPEYTLFTMFGGLRLMVDNPASERDLTKGGHRNAVKQGDRIQLVPANKYATYPNGDQYLDSVDPRTLVFLSNHSIMEIFGNKLKDCYNPGQYVESDEDNEGEEDDEGDEDD